MENQYERVILHKCPPPFFISREKVVLNTTVIVHFVEISLVALW